MEAEQGNTLYLVLAIGRDETGIDELMISPPIDPSISPLKNELLKKNGLVASRI